MQKWEYKVLSRYWTEGKWVWSHDQKEQRGVEELLNVLGREGWELVAAPTWLTQLWQPGGGHARYGPADTASHYICKRPA